MRFGTAVLAYAVAGLLGSLVARSARVRKPPFRWDKLAGPWFDNVIAELEDGGDGLTMRWHTGVVDGDNPPRLDLVGEVLIKPRVTS
jgi:hypothetical protein